MNKTFATSCNKSLKLLEHKLVFVNVITVKSIQACVYRITISENNWLHTFKNCNIVIERMVHSSRLTWIILVFAIYRKNRKGVNCHVYRTPIKDWLYGCSISFIYIFFTFIMFLWLRWHAWTCIPNIRPFAVTYVLHKHYLWISFLFLHLSTLCLNIPIFRYVFLRKLEAMAIAYFWRRRGTFPLKTVIICRSTVSGFQRI